MDKIAICVCTRKRKAGIKKLLHSLEELEIPEDTSLDVVVVENDNIRRSESIINEFKDSGKLAVRYFLEPEPGLVNARNRSVKEAGDCDFCCFVDDDQVVDRMWISELLKCQKEFDADGVWGSNPPLFDKEVPSWIRKFHTPKVFGYGERTKTAFTNSLMIRKRWLDRIDGPFDQRLSFTGGEDRFLAYNITSRGGIIVCNQEARAYEVVPESRTAIDFVRKRSFRISNANVYVKTLENENYSKWKAFPRLILRLGNGLLLALPYYLTGGQNKLKGIIKISNAIGGLAFILFGSKNEFYKRN
ncbi:MAG: glycosyltransferase [Bacteroidales bacterium]|nr:glycosyltransferase [Bacteroidales bacterium]